MAELVQANWVFIVLALLIGLVVAWWVFAANRKTRVEDAGDQSAAPGRAQRNAALIDAPPAATAARNTLDDTEDLQQARSAASPGPTSAAANTQEVAHATAAADAEAGPQITPTTAANAPQAAPAAVGSAGELTQIKGLGPKLEAQLAGLGVTRLEQIASWNEAEIDRIDSQLGRFQGRIRRDDWQGQARLLIAGDRAAYEGKFGKT